MKPIQIEVFSPLPEGWGLCLSCEVIMARANLDKAPYDRSFDAFPPEWQADFERLSAIILDIVSRFGTSIIVRVIDPRAMQGLFKSLLYGVRHYPTFVIDGKHKIQGWEVQRLEDTLRSLGAHEQIPQHV